MTVAEIAKKAKESSFLLGALPGAIKNRALQAMADALRAHASEILSANRQDLEAAQEAVTAGTMKSSLFERLKLSPEKLETVIRGISDLITLPDPVGKVLLQTALDTDLILTKVSCPIGLLGVIFEARPDVIPQIAALAVKSGNAAVLKGGKEAACTNTSLMKVLQQALEQIDGYPKNSLHLIHTREEAAEMLRLDKYFDLIIPRGSNRLIAYVKENTKIAVLGHADGVCHIYVAPSADLEKARKICIDAKTQYPSACNTLETLLLDEHLPQTFQKTLLDSLLASGVEIYGGPDVGALVQVAGEVTDWHTEYGDKKLSVKIVKNVTEAVTHINRFGSHHTDCILTRDAQEAKIFMDLVDSAGVYQNVSTRFADGYRYGFGAEVGISTGKTHARGPVGLEGLTIYKYKLIGDGQIVADYVGENAKPFLHKPVSEEK